MKLLKAIFSWAATLWICYVFLGSLPYKFTQHPDTQHIFSIIGEWLGGISTYAIGALFTKFGPYGVGSFELLTSILLLAPIVLWIIAKVSGRLDASTRSKRIYLHKVGGAMSAVVMCGAVFFHLFTPLGIEVLHQGESDGGSLFYAAVSIVVLGILLFIFNYRAR